MWFFKSENGAKVFYINKSDSFSIGRSIELCDYAILDDTSISRKHVALAISDYFITLHDLGSKYGTYINQNIETRAPVPKNSGITLNENDKLRFGILNNVWVLQKVDFVTSVSTMKGENLEHLNTILRSIGGTLKLEWDDSCRYLTMPVLTLTVKVLNALVDGAHIVNTNFWDKCAHNIAQNEPLPDPKLYLPQLAEPSLYSNEESFFPKEARKKLFESKKIVFFSRSQLERYKYILTKCSACVILLSESKMTKSKLCGEDIIVIEYNSAGMSQESQSQQHQTVKDLVNYLRNKSRRVIPETEISLAILYCSLEKHCNPQFNFELLNNCNKTTDKPSKILAPETQEPSTSKTKDNIVIDESLTSTDKTDLTMESMQIKDEPLESNNRNKRRCSDNIGQISKKIKPTIDINMFDFIESNESKSSTQSLKKQDLGFMKPKKRKNNVNSEDDIFNFIPDSKKVKDVSKDSSIFEKPKPKSASKSSESENSQNEKTTSPRSIELDEPSTSRDTSNGYKYDIKFDNKAWKSCSVIKSELKDETMQELESRVNSIDLGKTIVEISNDLIDPEYLKIPVQAPVNGSVVNYKRFQKIWPLQMQVTIYPTSSYQMMMPDASAITPELVNESSDEEEVIVENAKKTQKNKRRINI